MEITPELARPIVERAMAILQRNVNIMDARGYIVGSGDPSRLGSFHKGAEAVLKTGRRVEIYPEDAANWPGVRPGVNLALRLNRQIVGVVGITGPPDDVRPFGELIREMVQLMLAQARSAELERTTALAREALLRDLMTGAGELSEHQAREAKLMGLGTGQYYRVILCEPLRVSEPGDYAWVEMVTSRLDAIGREVEEETLLVTGPWEGRLVAVTGRMGDVVAAKLARHLGHGDWVVAAGLGGPGLSWLKRSYHTALLALTAGSRLQGSGLFLSDHMMLESMLVTTAQDDAAAFWLSVTRGLPKRGARQGESLRQTIDAYARSGMSLAAAADALGVHRHTLSYRLDQITDATGLDPRTWDGILRLYLGLQMERIFGQNVHS